jgi:broad specificity phosphatase PhoE
VGKRNSERKRTVVLVKHSAPVVERDVAPKRWHLSEEGRRRSVVLAERLRGYDPGVIVSSEEPKAFETAQIAAERLGIGCSTFPGLHEHDRTGAPFLKTSKPRTYSPRLAL